jgi:2-amino-4-hydroxy-6-hydroxymethyldihydropteridine diphosphokinase
MDDPARNRNDGSTIAQPLPAPCSAGCGIALGSNLGDRLGQLREAVKLMLSRLPQARLVAAAPLYESAPVGCPDGSGAFLNSVVEIEAPIAPHELLRVLRRIESDLGRPNEHAHHAPRRIDLDILYCGGITIDDEDLELPHPRLAERRFVLQPLADIRPDLVLPGRTETIAKLLGRLAPDGPPLRLVTRNWI